MTSLRLFKNLVNYGPVTSEFPGRGCAGRTARWALSRISSYKAIAIWHDSTIRPICAWERLEATAATIDYRD